MSLRGLVKDIGQQFVRLTKHGFVFGPLGYMLRKNLEAYWFLHCASMQRYNVFTTSKAQLSSTLKFLRENKMDNVPFGLVMTENQKLNWNQCLLPENYKVPHKIARVLIISNPSEAKDLFHKKQRERKIWWRKLVQHPSKFILTESKKMQNCNVLDINLSLPFGDFTVETLSHHEDISNLFAQDKTEKCDMPDMHIIDQQASLDWGCLALLGNGYNIDQPIDITIHPKLSPYKIVFQLHPVSEDNELNPKNEQLNRFMHYLNNNVRAAGFDTLVTCRKKVVDMSMAPYMVSVDESSIKNGIIHVRSRVTTLAEEVHVTELVKYIALRCS